MEALPGLVEYNPTKSDLIRIIICIRMQTSNVNHTGLMHKAIENGFNPSTFHARFKNTTKNNKNKEDREHDEVITICTKHFDLKSCFQDVKTRRKSERYVIIYKEIKNNDKEIKKYTQQLKDIAKCSRSTIIYPVQIVSNLNEIK